MLRDVSDEATDAQVIAASLRNPQLFGQIFERHFDAIYTYLARRTNDNDAEDLASEVFAVAVAKRDRFDLSRNDARPWLYGIAALVLAEQRRRSAKQIRDVAQAAAHLTVVGDNPMSGAIDRIDADRRIAGLRERIDGLNERDKTILTLHAWECLSLAEVAQALEMDASAVRVRMHRIRAALSKPVKSLREVSNA